MPAPKSVTPDEWNRIVAVYAKHNGRVTFVARELGWPMKRTARLWQNGYPSKGYPPIKTVLAHDHLSANAVRAARAELEAEVEDEVAPFRAAVLEATHAVVLPSKEQLRLTELMSREAEREKARQDAIKSRGEEASLVSAARRNALALNAVTAQVMRGAVKLSAKIQVLLEEEAVSSKLTVGQQLALVRQASQIARFNAEAATLAIKSERMVTGDPAGGDGGDGERGVDLEEAAKWVEASIMAVQRARQRGLLGAPTESDEPAPVQASQGVSPGQQTWEEPDDREPERDAPEDFEDDPEDGDDPEDDPDHADLPTAAEQRSEPRRRARPFGLRAV